ncbi:glycoside hydrolase family 32 protein [Litchfieldia salsa]|uniref:Sucrose-6-phosphate hydrolase n=1 Tax=Litchfieldia salsa TaxID=930152 RepID=A0A1H0WSQ5_9BACI|nr:glycoside hydrolase family 32 protein [Litchfieldia salsa]SDP93286.1 beta-fructofuranosidase [Litchfieldia salsa]
MKQEQKEKYSIERAMDEINIKSPEVAKDHHRLEYHVMGPTGWINDPNGLIQYKGEYHVFFQYYPFKSSWGPMHWGHVKSKDLVRWEHLPVALAPTEDYEENGGCFSGSAVDNNGELTLIFTGHNDNKNPKEVQCIATSTDGITFQKYEGNPVIPHPPVDGSPDFRDPKVWKNEDKWYMVVGSAKENKGKALLYRSDDLREWEYVNVLAESDQDQGNMWECPDIFPLGEKHVLIASPMEAKVGRTMYVVGDMNYETGKFTQGYYQKMDFGHDFYAPQSLLDDKGRRIVIGWMDIWGAKMPTQEKGWAGAMTIPRECKLLEDGKVAFLPVEELKTLRGAHWNYSDLVVKENQLLNEVRNDKLELKVIFDLEKTTASTFGVKLRCSEDGTEETVIGINAETKTVYVDRDRSGNEVTGISRAEVNYDGTVSLHIFLDCSSVEVFTDEGRTVLSDRIYPKEDSLGVELFVSEGQVTFTSLDIWELKA